MNREPPKIWAAFLFWSLGLGLLAWGFGLCFQLPRGLESTSRLPKDQSPKPET